MVVPGFCQPWHRQASENSVRAAARASGPTKVESGAKMGAQSSSMPPARAARRSSPATRPSTHTATRLNRQPAMAARGKSRWANCGATLVSRVSMPRKNQKNTGHWARPSPAGASHMPLCEVCTKAVMPAASPGQYTLCPMRAGQAWASMMSSRARGPARLAASKILSPKPGAVGSTVGWAAGFEKEAGLAVLPVLPNIPLNPLAAMVTGRDAPVLELSGLGAAWAADSAAGADGWEAAAACAAAVCSPSALGCWPSG